MARSTRIVGALGVLLASAGIALGQQTTVQVTGTGVSGGLIGQRAAFPNVLGWNITPPLERRVTLLPPPLVPTQPQATPAVVVGPWYGSRGDGGVRIDGKYDDGDWSVSFHLGDPVWVRDGGTVYRWPYSRGYSIRDGLVYAYPYWYTGGSYYSTRPVDGVLTQQVDSTLRSPQVTQPQPEAEPARELTALGKAYLCMAADELDLAVEFFREQLDEDPEDVRAMRALGVAMAENNRMGDGVSMIALAYTTDPQLARTPLVLAELGLDARRYDTLLARVLQFARRVDSGSAHLAGAVLLQADGKVAGASRVLDRAEESGLGDEIVDPFRRELGVPANSP